MSDLLAADAHDVVVERHDARLAVRLRQHGEHVLDAVRKLDVSEAHLEVLSCGGESLLVALVETNLQGVSERVQITHSDRLL